MRTAFHRTKLDSEPPDRKSFSNASLSEGIMSRGFRRIRTLGANLLIGTAIFCSSVEPLSAYANPPDPKSNVVYEKRNHVTSIFGIPSPLDVQEGKSAKEMYKDKDWLYDKFVTTSDSSILGADSPRTIKLGDLDPALKEMIALITESMLKDWTTDLSLDYAKKHFLSHLSSIKKYMEEWIKINDAYPENNMSGPNDPRYIEKLGKFEELKNKYMKEYDNYYKTISDFINENRGVTGVLIYNINEMLNDALFFDNASAINLAAATFYRTLSERKLTLRRLLPKAEVDRLFESSPKSFRPFIEALLANKVGFKLMTKGTGEAAGTITREGLEAAGIILVPIDIANLFELDMWVQHYRSMCYPDDAKVIVYYTKGFKLENIGSLIKAKIDKIINFINDEKKIAERKDIDLTQKIVDAFTLYGNAIVEFAKEYWDLGMDITKSIPNIKWNFGEGPTKDIPILNGIVLGYDKPFFIVLPDDYNAKLYGFEPAIAKVHGKVVFDGGQLSPYYIELRSNGDKLDPIINDDSSPDFNFIAGVCPSDEPKYSLVVSNSIGPPLVESEELTFQKGGDYTVNVTVKSGCKKYKTETAGANVAIYCDDNKPASDSEINLGNFLCQRDEPHTFWAQPGSLKRLIINFTTTYFPTALPIRLCNMNTGGNGLNVTKMTGGVCKLTDGLNNGIVDLKVEGLVNGTTMDISTKTKLIGPLLKEFGLYGTSIKVSYKCNYVNKCD